ncbi:nuclear transport factor 2 family protein [Frankia canadensis]|uniref:nuclear transport factor 2 family protein n=1 Tax=Frankia canadensis TaxID=1836972 RepID=UPI001402871E|nr:nuclear transport factor 2 family protein [Frankia canadensis]
MAPPIPVAPSGSLALPAAVERYVAASNTHDRAALLATFAPDCSVTDAGREFRGAEEIGGWLDREIISASVTMKVIAASEHHGEIVLRAVIDGVFDRTGLPDPLILTFRFTVREDRIVRMIISLDETDPR